MATIYYVLASLAAALLIVAICILVGRALLLMARLEDTRRDLAQFLAEASLSLQHVNRLVARSQEGVDRLQYSLERIERIFALLQPAAVVGGLFSGARKAQTGRQSPTASPPTSQPEGENS